MAESLDSFGARDTMRVGDETYTIYRLGRAAERLGINLDRLPFTIRILLENLLRFEDGVSVTEEQIRAIGSWDPAAEPEAR